MTYSTYCALCHGIDGAPGMFVEDLKKAAPDLTKIAKRIRDLTDYLKKHQAQ